MNISISVFVLLFSTSLLAKLEIIKPEFKSSLVLKIVRVTPDSFETYSLHNSNGREMTLVCAQNRYYENNKEAFIEYRNFYNEIAGRFTIENDTVCKEMGKFIEASHAAVDEWKPFVITLNKKLMKVEKIVYPNIDPLTVSGEMKDLLPKKRILDFYKPDGIF